MSGRAGLFVAAFFAFAPLTSATRAQATPRILGARHVSPTVSIKGWNPAGSVRFIAWDKDSVVVRGTLGRGMTLLFAGDGDGLKLGADGHWSDGKAMASDFVVYVPRRATVTTKTVSADITGEGVGGWFSTISGDVRLTGSAKSVEAESMNGNLDLAVTTPWLRARTGDGNLIVRGAPEDVDAATVGGTLSVATSAIVRGQFASVTGDIVFAGAPAARGIFDFSNHAGNVELLMPTAASARVALSTISGAIDNRFARMPATTRPAQATGQAQSQTLHLGAGDARMNVRTFKGIIRLVPQ